MKNQPQHSAINLEVLYVNICGLYYSMPLHDCMKQASKLVSRTAIPLVLLWFQIGPQIRISRAFFVILLLCMRRNTINSTFGFKTDLKFGFPVPKNIYTREITPSTFI